MRLPRPGAVLTGAAPVPIAMLVVLVVAVVVAPLIALLIALAAAPTAGSTAPAAAAPSVDGHYRGFGDAGGFLNILPPGQKGTLTAAELAQVNAATTSSAGANDPSAYPAHVADQRQMYDDLNFAPTITDSTLTKYYKDASFGLKPDDVARVYHPTRDVTVIRDKSFDVPHIFGTTRAATMFAEGYTTAEDRLLTMDLLRRVGRGTLSELVGTQGLSIDRGTVSDSPYTEADLQAQIAKAARRSRTTAPTSPA
jgi:hypothetical protein